MILILIDCFILFNLQRQFVNQAGNQGLKNSVTQQQKMLETAPVNQYSLNFLINFNFIC